MTRNTVKNILKRNGFDTGPNRGPGTWDEFLKRHAKTMWQCDFFSKKIVSKTGLRDIFVLVFLHVETRHVFITPATYKPDEKWMVEQGKAFIKHAEENKLLCRILMLDNDLIHKPSPTTRNKSNATTETICLSDIRCKERLDGLLKSYSRKAA